MEGSERMGRPDHRPRRLIALGGLLILLLGPRTPAQDRPRPDAGADGRRAFQAGAATSNITPPLGEPIVGGWTSPPATHIHDELHARCLVLDDGRTKLAFAVCDNVGIPRQIFEAAKKMVQETTGIPGDHILMAATHSHSATSARGENALVDDKELTGY